MVETRRERERIPKHPAGHALLLAAISFVSWACRTGEALPRAPALAGTPAPSAAPPAPATAEAADCGTPQQCFEAALKLDTPDAADRKEATRLYEKACGGKFYRACNNLGILKMLEPASSEERWENHTGAPAAAVELFRKACDFGGTAPGCFNRGLALMTGEGVAKDLELGLGFIERLCEDDHIPSCHLLAIALDTPGWLDAKRKPNKELAEKLYRKACDSGRLDACSDLGRMMARARPPRNPAEIRRLYERACAGGSLAACNNFGVVLEQAGDIEGARQKYEAACKAGHEGCDNLKHLLAKDSPQRTFVSQTHGFLRDPEDAGVARR